MRIVGGKYKRRPLKAPPGLDVRPTSDRARESLFNILEHGIDDFNIVGASVIDVFAGTGALGLEALSRGAAHACFIDHDQRALKCTQANAGAIGEGRNVTLLKLDAVNLPPPPLAAQAPCTLAFLDPPYRSGLAVDALRGLKTKGWISDGTICVVELAAKEVLTPPDSPRDISISGFKELDQRTYGAAQVLFLRTLP